VDVEWIPRPAQSIVTPTSSKSFVQQDLQVETPTVFEADNEVSSFSVKVYDTLYTF